MLFHHHLLKIMFEDEDNRLRWVQTSLLSLGKGNIHDTYITQLDRGIWHLFLWRTSDYLSSYLSEPMCHYDSKWRQRGDPELWFGNWEQSLELEASLTL